MRISLTIKLLTILAITSTVSVLAMGLAARWSFQHGFLDFLAQNERQQIAPLEAALIEVYEVQGSWDRFRRNPEIWPRFVDDVQAANNFARPRRPMPSLDLDSAGGGIFPQPTRPDAAPALPELHEGQSFPPSPGPGFTPPPGRPGAGLPPPMPGSLATRLQLLDSQRRIVVGGPQDVEEAPLIALQSKGATIGWLNLSPPLWLEDELAQRFYSQHNRSLLLIAVSSLTLATLLGWVFGEGLLRRIRRLAGGVRTLAKGDYQTRLVGTGQDELAELTDDFNHLATALERNEDLRRRGMADVSHELRTPVAVARAELDALIDGIRPCTIERLTQLQSRLVDLTRLLDDLYDLALSDAGALDYHHASVNLEDILEAAVIESQAVFADKGVALRLESDEALPIVGDRGRLRQVLDNLLSNSLRYTDSGGFTRVIATRTGDEIKVLVSDTPPGVHPDALAHLFDRFFREEVSRTRAKGGAGLGLAICRNIVEAHRGHISARPADSGGLEIEIRLPATNQ